MLLKSVIIIFIFSIISGPAGSVDYEVTVVTTPSSGPFLTNVVVEFLCLIDPTPPEPVTYNWEFQRNAEFSTSDLFTGQRLSHIQLYLSFRFIWYFCKVYSNDNLVAVGSKLIEYHDSDVLFANNAPVQTFVPGGRVLFNVTNSGIHGVTWHHNGTEVEGSDRISINESQLIIGQAVSSDAGVYQLRITSLSSSCNESSGDWFHLLENLATYAPITYYLQETGQGAPWENNPLDVLPNKPAVLYFSESDSQQRYFSISGTYNIRTSTSFLGDGLYQLLWVHNGTRLNLDRSRYRASLSVEPGVLRITLEIFDFRDNDAGFYIGVVNTEPSNLFSYFDCDGVDRVRHIQIPIGLVPISLQKIEFTLSMEVTNDGSVILTCGVESDPNNDLLFTLRKENITLISQRSSLMFNASSFTNPYGLYVCTLERSTKNVTLLLREHAKLYAQVSIEEGACQELLDDSRAGLVLEIKNLFQRLCSCSESPTVEITTYQCSSSGNSLYLEGVLVYSDEEGRITASTLIDMLTLWTVSARPPILSVNGVQHTLQLLPNTCPFLISSFQNVCFEFSENNAMCSPERNIMGVFSGLFMGGFVAGVILSCMVCTVVIAWLQYRNRFKSTKQTPQDGSTSMRTITNDAYGVVVTNNAYGVVLEQSDGSTYAQCHEYCDIGMPAQRRVQVQDD